MAGIRNAPPPRPTQETRGRCTGRRPIWGASSSSRAGPHGCRMSLPFHRVSTNLSLTSGITNASGTPLEGGISLFPCSRLSHPSSAMSLPLVPLLQTQLETTLRLLISVSQEMTPDEIMAVRIRLNEAALVMGDIIANQSNNTTNGNPASISALQPR